MGIQHTIHRRDDYESWIQCSTFQNGLQAARALPPGPGAAGISKIGLTRIPFPSYPDLAQLDPNIWPLLTPLFFLQPPAKNLHEISSNEKGRWSSNKTEQVIGPIAGEES